MRTCSLCRRNLDKRLHNWMEVLAGAGLLVFLAPLMLWIWQFSPLTVLATLPGLVILMAACVVHLWVEARVKYPKD